MNHVHTDIYEKLKSSVEKYAGCVIATPRDFSFLSSQILATTKQYMSPITLKRLWGYINTSEEYTPRLYTLNLLSQYIGFKDFETFTKSLEDDENSDSSDFILNTTLHTSQLRVGDIIKLTWLPNREVLIKYMGQDMFSVEKSVNSKLQNGDIFCCHHFIQDEPLILTRLIRPGINPTNYVCGKNGGIRFVQLQAKWGG